MVWRRAASTHTPTGCAECPSRVIRDRRSRTIVHVRFAPKAAFTNEDVIRRVVPQADFIAV